MEGIRQVFDSFDHKKTGMLRPTEAHGRCGKGAEGGCSEHLFSARMHDFLMSGKGTFVILWVFLWV